MSEAGARRRDAPVVDPARAAGVLPQLDEDGLREAKEKFLEDVHAPSQRHVVRAKLQTVERAMAMWKLAPFPPSVEKIQALGSVLKAGRYKSSESYFAIYKAESERRSFVWSPAEQRAVRDAVRSCQRGLGGPQRALPLPFDKLDLLPGGVDPWTGGGPVAPRNLVVLGSWFMLREVEAANARVGDVTVDVREGRPRVIWTLPASKTDQKAAGRWRATLSHSRAQTYGENSGSGGSAEGKGGLPNARCVESARLFLYKYPKTFVPCACGVGAGVHAEGAVWRGRSRLPILPGQARQNLHQGRGGGYIGGSGKVLEGACRDINGKDHGPFDARDGRTGDGSRGYGLMGHTTVGPLGLDGH